MAMLRSVMKLRPLIQGVPAAHYHEKVGFYFQGCIKFLSGGGVYQDVGEE